MKDVTFHPGLQGEVRFQQVQRRGWSSGTEKPEGVAGQVAFPGLGVSEEGRQKGCKGTM